MAPSLYRGFIVALLVVSSVKLAQSEGQLQGGLGSESRAFDSVDLEKHVGNVNWRSSPSSIDAEKPEALAAHGPGQASCIQMAHGPGQASCMQMAHGPG